MGVKKQKPRDVKEDPKLWEERFENLMDLSSEWYWEQNEDLRYTLLTGSIAAHGGLDPRKIIGTYRWDRGAVPLDDGGNWDKHKAALKARQPFSNLVYKRPDSKIGVCFISTSGQPVFDEKGRFRGYRGVAKDITKSRRDEQLLALEHAITRALGEADSASAALQSTIHAICESENWECGRSFVPDEKAGVLRLAETWGIQGEPVERFIAASRNLSYAPGVGLAGQVWQSGKPLWSSDITRDARVAQSKLARDSGMHGAFVFPVTFEGKVAGVLAFNSREVREPDERLLQAVRVISSQIGQFLQRKRVEEEQRRFRIAMDNSADMIVLIDRAAMRFVDVNNTACGLLGYSREELLQMGPQDVLPASRAELERAYDEFIANPSHITGMHSYYRRKDGSTFPFESTRHVLRSGDTHIIAAISRDVSARVAAEEALRASEERFRSLTQLSTDMYWEQDDQFRFTSMSGTGSKRVNVKTFPAAGKKRWEQNYINMTADQWAGHIALLEAHQEFRDMELCRLDESGKKIWISISGAPVFDSSGAFRGYRGVGKDITERKHDEEHIHFLANHDALTSLPNRAMFGDVLGLAIQNARRYNRGFAVLFIDLDQEHQRHARPRRGRQVAPGDGKAHRSDHAD